MSATAYTTRREHRARRRTARARRRALLTLIVTLGLIAVVGHTVLLVGISTWALV